MCLEPGSAASMASAAPGMWSPSGLDVPSSTCSGVFAAIFGSGRLRLPMRERDSAIGLLRFRFRLGFILSKHLGFDQLDTPIQIINGEVVEWRMVHRCLALGCGLFDLFQLFGGHAVSCSGSLAFSIAFRKVRQFARCGLGGFGSIFAFGGSDVNLFNRSNISAVALMTSQAIWSTRLIRSVRIEISSARALFSRSNCSIPSHRLIVRTIYPSASA